MSGSRGTAFFWSIAQRMTQRGVAIAFLLFLAAEVGPADVGAIAIPLTVYAVFEITVANVARLRLMKIGTDVPEEAGFVTATALAAGLGFILVSALAGIALTLGPGWHVTGIFLAALSVIATLRCLGVPYHARLLKSFAFRGFALASILAAALAGGAGFWALQSGAGIYALLAFHATMAVATVAGLRLAAGPIGMRLELSGAQRELHMDFLRSRFSAEITMAVAARAELFVLTTLVTPLALGQYFLARRIRDACGDLMDSSLAQVALADLARSVDAKEKTIIARRFAIMAGLSVSAAVYTGLFLVSENLIQTVLSPDWSEAATYLPLLCLLGFWYSAGRIGMVILSIGVEDAATLPRLSRRYAVANVVLVVAAAPFGVIAAIWAMIAAQLFMVTMQLRAAARIAPFRPADIGAIVLAPTIGAGSVALALLVLRQSGLAPEQGVVALVAETFAGGIALALVSVAFLKRRILTRLKRVRS